MSRKHSRRKQRRGRQRAVVLIFACLCILAAGLCAWGMQAGSGEKEREIIQGQDSDSRKKEQGDKERGADKEDEAYEDEASDLVSGNEEGNRLPEDGSQSQASGNGEENQDQSQGNRGQDLSAENEGQGKFWGNILEQGSENALRPEAGENPENPGAAGGLRDNQDSLISWGKSGAYGQASGWKDKDPSWLVSQMPLEARVAQLFLITPEQLTGYSQVTQAGEATKEALEKYPVGGLIYFAGNLKSPEQLKGMTENTQQFADELGIFPLFLAIDEEGGDVARIGNNGAFSVPSVPSMASIGASGDVRKAYEAGDTIGEYLSRLGINLDFAPDADVLTNPDNTVVKTRSFGSDPDLVTQMAVAYLKGLNSHGIYGAPKHFPGHGATAEDSHKGFAYVNKTWEELERAELVPFAHFAEQKVNFLMSGHISLPAITGSDLPCSLSKDVLDGYLREKMGYQGIIITDALNMGAIQNHYSSGEAAVAALEAGVDMLLMPANFQEAYEAVLDAVRQGRISEECINQSAERIIQRKIGLVS